MAGHASGADRAQIAGQADRAAELAFRAGDYAKALRLLNLAQTADPSRAQRWAEHSARVHQVAREAAATVAAPGDPRPLDDAVQTRLTAAGVTAGHPQVRFIAQWNAERGADDEPQLNAGDGGVEARS